MQRGQDQWAYQLLCEHLDARRKLRNLHQELTFRINQGEEELKGEREWVGSMLHESAEVIPMIAAYCAVEQLGPKERRLVQRLQRLTYGKKDKIHSWDTAWMERLPDQRSLEDEIIEKIEGTEMEDAMTIDLYHLPERQREALELLASGMSYSEVAEMMQIAKGSVSKHLQLARKKLEDGAQLAWQLE